MAADPLTITGGGLDPTDRDAMIRTIVAEGGNSPDGMGAVANVIKNRLASGNFGNSPAAVVLAPKQFEVWSDGSAAKVDPNSPQYQQAARIVDAVASGQVPDNTGGATHFFSPSGQAARAGDGRQQVPDWAKNQTASIGGNVFFAPDGPVRVASAGGATPQPQAAPTVSFGGQQNPLDPGPPSPSPPAAAKPAAAAQGANDPFEDMLGGKLAASPSTASAAAPATPSAADDPFEQMMATGAASAKLGAAMANPASQPAPISFNTPASATALQPSAGGDAAAAMGAGVISGIPVIGAPAQALVERGIVAPLRMLSHGESYADALKKAQDFDTATAANHPYATTAGGVLGGGLATAPLAVAAPAAFGLAKGANMLTRMGAAAGTGAAIGGADGLVRSGGDPASTAYGALSGGAFGAAGPLAGQAIGQGANKLMTAVGKARAAAQAGIPIQVQNALIPAMQQDGETAIRNQLAQFGPQGMLADTGSATKGVAQGVALTPEGKTLIAALDARKAGQNGRIDAAVQGLGPAEDPLTVTNDLKAQRSAVDAGYDAIHDAAPDVDVSGVVAGIDGRLQSATGAQRTALQKIRDELVATPASVDAETGATTPETYVTDSQTLHNVRKDIDSVVNYGAPGLGVEKGAVMGNQAALKGVRGDLDGALKTQVPGMAAQDAQSAALARQAEAVQDGVNTLASPKGSPQPAAFKAAFDAKPVAEQVAQAKGLVGEINRLVGVNKNDLGAMDNAMQGGGVNGEGGFGALKAKAVLGDAPVDNMLSTIANERQFGQTYNDVAGNAQSAFRTEAKKSLDATPSMGQNVNLAGLTATGAVAQGAKSLIYNPLVKILTASDTGARDAMLAKILGSQGPARDEFVNKLFQAAGYTAKAPAWAGTLGNVGNLLTQAGGRAATLPPLTIGQPAEAR